MDLLNGCDEERLPIEITGASLRSSPSKALLGRHEEKRCVTTQITPVKETEFEKEFWKVSACYPFLCGTQLTVYRVRHDCWRARKDTRSVRN